MKVQDLSGQKFEKLTAIEYVGEYKWKCICDCGKITTVMSKMLKGNRTKSCGCIQVKKDLHNKMFGYLKVIDLFEIVCEKGAYWSCLCVCGKLIQVSRGNLLSGNSKSCGCKRNKIIKQTCLERYGFEHSSQSKKIKDKKINTNLKRYGVKHPSQNKEIREKQKVTCMIRYGVDNPTKNAKIALKAAKNTNNSFVLFHWKTKEELVCVASYEKRVVEYLNKNRIDFKWQHKVFNILLKNGKKATYRPDLYIIGKKKPWIEIKGYFRGDAQEKWDIFHNKIKTNSELWGKAKLKDMGIL